MDLNAEQLQAAFASLTRHTEIAIASQTRNLDLLRLYLKEYQDVSRTIDELVGRVRHKVLAPFGRVAFQQAEMIHTNEYLIHLGEDLMVEMSAAQATDFLSRRISDIKERIQAGEKQLMIDKSNLGRNTNVLNLSSALSELGIDGASQDGDGTEGVMEIMEELPAETIPAVTVPMRDGRSREELEAAKEEKRRQVQENFDRVLSSLKEMEEATDSDDEESDNVEQKETLTKRVSWAEDVTEPRPSRPSSSMAAGLKRGFLGSGPSPPSSVRTTPSTSTFRPTAASSTSPSSAASAQPVKSTQPTPPPLRDVEERTETLPSSSSAPDPQLASLIAARKDAAQQSRKIALDESLYQGQDAEEEPKPRLSRFKQRIMGLPE